MTQATMLTESFPSLRRVNRHPNPEILHSIARPRHGADVGRFNSFSVRCHEQVMDTEFQAVVLTLVVRLAGARVGFQGF